MLNRHSEIEDVRLALKLSDKLQRASITHHTDPWIKAMQFLQRTAGLKQLAPEPPRYPLE
jgi:uncharacterized phage-associated protein